MTFELRDSTPIPPSYFPHPPSPPPTPTMLFLTGYPPDFIPRVVTETDDPPEAPR